MLHHHEYPLNGYDKLNDRLVGATIFSISDIPVIRHYIPGAILGTITKEDFLLPFGFGTEIWFKVTYNPDLVDNDECRLSIEFRDDVDHANQNLFKSSFKIKYGATEMQLTQGSRINGGFVNYEEAIKKQVITNVVVGENQIRIVVGEDKFHVYINELLYIPVVPTDRLVHFGGMDFQNMDESECFAPIADTILIIHRSEKSGFFFFFTICAI